MPVKGQRQIHKPWVKLHIRMLHNHEIAQLPDSSYRRFTECLLFAGEERNRAIEEKREVIEGLLPDTGYMAWTLHVTVAALTDDMSRLALAGLVELHESGRWFVTNFAKWQAPSTDAERQQQHRAKEKESTKEKETDKELDIRGRIIDSVTVVTTSSQNVTSVPAASPPPLKVISQPIDRTPKGFQKANGYHPPIEPEPPTKATRPEAERQAIGHLINAIVDVTGKAAKLNPDVTEFAEELYPLGYNADQVRRAYSRNQTTGWNWFTNHWKGRDKNDMPTVKDIRETIAAATEEKKQAKKLSQLDIALGMGNGGLS